MSTRVGRIERGPVALTAVVLASMALLVVAVAENAHPVSFSLVAFALLAAALSSAALTKWSTLLVGLVLVILFIPIRRYTLPGSLPFDLEPYRVLVAVVCLLWLAAILVDSRVRPRRSGLEGPLALIAVGAIASVLANIPRIEELDVSSDVAKKLTFFASFFLIFAIIVSVVRSWELLDRILAALVGGGAVVAVLAIIEGRTNYNVFTHLSSVVPFLSANTIPYSLAHGTDRLRAYASAEHPIALGALLIMLVPIAVYLARRTGHHRWWAAAALLVLGMLATRSRTAIVMSLVILLVFLWLRPQATRKQWPVLLVVVVAAALLLPGTFSSMRNAFFPPGGLVAEQAAGGTTRGSGRIADIRPSLEEFAERPLVGEGFGTRIVDKERQNARILDDQWLGTLLETGLVGVIGWIWLFTRSVRRLSRRAKEDMSPRGWLFVALAASITAFAVGMLTYDAFSFVQVTFVAFILIGLGAAALQLAPQGAPLLRSASRGRALRASAAEAR